MKKIASLLLIAVSIYSFTFAQKNTGGILQNEQEIAGIIFKSKELNKQQAGVLDPNLIYPGQTLHFIFTDGDEVAFPVVTGDNQWSIVKRIKLMEKIHGEAVDYPIVEEKEKEKVVAATPPVSKDNSSLLFWILAALALLSLLLIAIRKSRKNKEEARQDPITSGPPMRSGGVSDAEAYQYAREVAARRFNSPNFTVTAIESGMLSGKNLKIYYQGEPTPKRRTFANQPAYRGTVNIDEREEFIYFLQPCGNDARIGNFFNGSEITFVPNPAQSEILRNAATPALQEAAQETKTEEVHSGFNMSDVVAKLAETLKDKKQGSISIEDGERKITMEFSEGLVIPKNGQAKEIKTDEAVQHS
jgi:hypothetical protein